MQTIDDSGHTVPGADANRLLSVTGAKGLDARLMRGYKQEASLRRRKNVLKAPCAAQCQPLTTFNKNTCIPPHLKGLPHSSGIHAGPQLTIPPSAALRTMSA